MVPEIGVLTRDTVPVELNSDRPFRQTSILCIHTLAREDIFAGWRSDNMERHARGEKNIDNLLKLRPEARADLLAWKGRAMLYHAVLGHEANESDEFQRYMRKSLDSFSEARELSPRGVAVAEQRK